MLHTIIVAGGRGSRLAKTAPAGTPPKPLLPDANGSELLTNTVTAGSQGGQVIVVAAAELVPEQLHERVKITREDPPLSGPASAIAAGINELADGENAVSSQDRVLILATDYADPHKAVAQIIEADQRRASGSGTVAVADGHREPLLCIIDIASAQQVFSGVRGGSVMRVLEQIPLEEFIVDSGIVADIDTWQDAQDYGFDVSAFS